MTEGENAATAGEVVGLVAMMVYVFLIWTLSIGATGYVVFILHRSGWWFLLAIIIASMATSMKVKINDKKGQAGEG